MYLPYQSLSACSGYNDSSISMPIILTSALEIRNARIGRWYGNHLQSSSGDTNSSHQIVGWLSAPCSCPTEERWTNSTLIEICSAIVPIFWNNCLTFDWAADASFYLHFATEVFPHGPLLGSGSITTNVDKGWEATWLAQTSLVMTLGHEKTVHYFPFIENGVPTSKKNRRRQLWIPIESGLTDQTMTLHSASCHFSNA